MTRRFMYVVIIMCLFLIFPGMAFAGNGQQNGFNSGSGMTGISVGEQTQTAQETQNTGETSQVQKQQANQNGENTPADTPSGTCEQLLQQTRDRLQVMERDRIMTQDDWALVEENLLQLKNQYRTRVDQRQEIWNTYQLTLQNARVLGTEQNRERLLRDMISLDPQSVETYQELGTLFQNRGEVQCHLWCNGSEVVSDTPSIIRDGRTLVPIRALAEAMGAQVEWQQEEQTVLVSKGDTQIRLQVQNRTALINGQPVELDVPAGIIDSRLFVPIRFCAQAFNADIAYYPEGPIVAINQE